VALRVLVCVKRVPAPGARITLTSDHQAIDTKNLGFTTSPHEECAVEEGIRLVETHGGEATVVTLGPAEADEQLRYAVSVGIAKAVHASHPNLSDGETGMRKRPLVALTEVITSTRVNRWKVRSDSCSATSRRMRATSKSVCAWRVRSGVAWSTAIRPSRSATAR